MAPTGTTASSSSSLSSSAPIVTYVSFDHHHSGLGVGTSKPSLTWRLEGNATDWVQEAYEIEISFVDRKPPFSAIETRLFAGKSPHSINVAWPGRGLRSGEEAAVRVRCFAQGVETPWSQIYRVEAGLLEAADWTCALIETPFPVDENKAQTPALFRRPFNVAQRPQRARLYITSHGVHNVEINGVSVSDQVLAPGWTAYEHELQFIVHDVGRLLHAGTGNVIGVHVAEGWYCGRLGFGGGRHNIWGTRLGVIALLVIQYPDGSTEKIGSDARWTCDPSHIEQASLYDGETDNRLKHRPGWSSTGFKDAGWSEVVVSTHDRELLRCADGPPIRPTETLAPVQVLKSAEVKGNFILDFGQNLVGWVRFRVPAGPSGHKISLIHAEVLEQGECVTRTLRHAKATDTLILGPWPGTIADATGHYWEPKFTFHGFRYVELVNWPQDQVRPADFSAVVIHSDMHKTGSLSCSDPLINRLHQNVVWSMRGNFVGIPTDCPQRDERLGYTGDIQVFTPTACFLYDCYTTLRSWLRSLAAEQKAGDTGSAPMFSPKAMPVPNFPLAVWGDAVILVPWELYWAYGDASILACQYDSMADWIDRGIPRAPNGLWAHVNVQLGDWLDPLAPADRPYLGSTDAQLVANAYLVRITDIMGRVSGVLSKDAKASAYEARAVELRRSFAAEYITETGRLVSDSQTALALAIQFDLFPTSSQRDHAVERLRYLILHRSRCKIATGFAGTSLIGHALSKVGLDQLFYMMLINTKPPSWLYPVSMGATTIWERWDSVLPDGTVHPSEMTSLNHYALGSVADWLHARLGGLVSLAPGWKHFLVDPKPGGGVTRASMTFESPHGKIAVDWELEDGYLVVKVEVPLNTTAEVQLSSGQRQPVGSGSHSFRIKYTEPTKISLPPPMPHTTEEDDPRLL